MSIPRLAAYTAVGAVGTLAHYLVLVVLIQWSGVAPVPASLAGYLVGAVTNYGLNHRLTFRGAAPHRRAVPRFFAIAGIGFLLNGAVMQILVHGIGLHYLVGQIVATALVLIVGYLANACWSFRHD